MARSIIGAWAEMEKAEVLGVIDIMFPSKAELARKVGVSDRSAQRWFTEGSEKRGISEKNLQKIKQLLPAVLVNVKGLFRWDSPKNSKRKADQRVRDIEFVVGGDYLPAMIAAINAGDEDRAFTIALEAYGMVDDDQPQTPLVENAEISMVPVEASDDDIF